MRASPFTLVALLAAGAATSACSSPTPAPAPASVPVDPNPAAPGFDRAGSDESAIALADAVMERLGGRAAWDSVGAIYWDFFGLRKLVWDKQRERVRVELDDASILLDLTTQSGRAWREEGEITDGADLAALLASAHQVWVNDAYWLAMPFKLKDTGVTLQDAGSAPALDGTQCRVLDLTFDGVGYTPGNRYRVLVDPTSLLVVQWDFYTERSDSEPTFQAPWTGWQPHGDLWLSGGRGERALGGIAVFDSLPAEALEGPAPFVAEVWEPRPTAGESSGG